MRQNSNIQIVVRGQSSESKNEIATALVDFFVDRGYGDVTTTGSDIELPLPQGEGIPTSQT